MYPEAFIHNLSNLIIRLILLNFNKDESMRVVNFIQFQLNYM